jgi:hypothetical protein
MFLAGIYWKYLVVGLILGFKYSFLENREKESATKFLLVGWTVGLDIIVDLVQASTQPPSSGPSAVPSRFSSSSSDLLQDCRHGSPSVLLYLRMFGLTVAVGFLRISIRPTLLANFSASPIYSSRTSPPYRYFQPPDSALLLLSCALPHFP